MKTLILLRHAKSSRDDLRMQDHDRPLAPRGVRACETLGRWLAASDHPPELVLCSSARRAQDTLAGVLPHLPGPPEVRTLRSLYLAGPREMLEAVARVEEPVSTLMLVGHNPGMHMLAADLAARGDPEALERLGRKFPTAAVACFRLSGGSWRKLDVDRGQLLHFVTPRSLAT